MTEAEFIKENDILEKYYEKELNQIQRKVWYEELKNIPVQNYRRIIRETMKSCKYMPKLADINAIKDTIHVETDNTKSQIIKTNCNICKGTGLIRFSKRIENGKYPLIYDYVARCICKNSKNYEWIDPKTGNFIIPSAKELNLI